MKLGYIGKPTLKQKKTKSKQSNQQYEPKTPNEAKSSTFQTKKLSYEKPTNIYQINLTWKYFPCVFL